MPPRGPRRTCATSGWRCPELAERLRGRAKVERGPHGFTPTATELVDLASQVQAVAIACDRATGLSWAAIASRTGLSRDRVRRECRTGAEVAARLARG